MQLARGNGEVQYGWSGRGHKMLQDHGVVEDARPLALVSNRHAMQTGRQER